MRKCMMTGTLLFVFASVGAVAAQNGQDNDNDIILRRPLLAGLVGTQGFIRSMAFSDDQKMRIKSTMAANRVQILHAARDILEARRNRSGGNPEGGCTLAEAQMRAFRLKQQISGQIRSILNEEQIAWTQSLLKMKNQRLEHFIRRLEARIGS